MIPRSHRQLVAGMCIGICGTLWVILAFVAVSGALRPHRAVMLQPLHPTLAACERPEERFKAI